MIDFSPNELRSRFLEGAIPLRRTARRVGISHTYLRIVLLGERSNPDLLRQVAQVILQPDRTAPQRPQREANRLIEAGCNLFLVKNGYYRSAICRAHPSSRS